MHRAALIVLLVICACGSAPQAGASLSPAAGSGLPAGWRYVTNKSNVTVVDVSKLVPTGFRIALPPDWDAHDLDRDVLTKNFRAWAAQNPKDAEGTSEQSYVDEIVATTKLLAWPRNVDAKAPVQLHISARWIDHAITLNDLIRDQTHAYQLSGATYRSSSRTSVGERDAFALRMQYGPIGAVHVQALTAYFLLRDREVWDIEFIGPIDDIDRLEPIFEQIAESFRFI